MFLCGVADAFARGVEGKLRFAARGAWPHGPAARRENSVFLRNALAAWPCGVEGNSASLRAVRGRTALRCGGKIPCCCAMRWQHGLRRRGKASLRAVRGRTALRRRGKIPCCCAMRWQHGPRCGRKTSLCCVWCAGNMALRRRGKASLRAVRGRTAMRCGRKTSLCCVWCAGSMALRRGGKTLLCAVGERGKQGIFYSKMYYFRKIIQKVLNFTAARPSHRRPAVC